MSTHLETSDVSSAYPATTPWSSPHPPGTVTRSCCRSCRRQRPLTGGVGGHARLDRPQNAGRHQRLGPNSVRPDELRSTSTPLLDWLNATGATKVAIHFDVDTIDADEMQLGLGADIGGLTSTEARRLVADIDTSTDVVGLTIAEYIPRQVMHLQQLLAGFPLLGR